MIVECEEVRVISSKCGEGAVKKARVDSTREVFGSVRMGEGSQRVVLDGTMR